MAATIGQPTRSLERSDKQTPARSGWLPTVQRRVGNVVGSVGSQAASKPLREGLAFLMCGAGNELLRGSVFRYGLLGV